MRSTYLIIPLFYHNWSITLPRFSPDTCLESTRLLKLCCQALVLTSCSCSCLLLHCSFPLWAGSFGWPHKSGSCWSWDNRHHMTCPPPTYLPTPCSSHPTLSSTSAVTWAFCCFQRCPTLLSLWTFFLFQNSSSKPLCKDSETFEATTAKVEGTAYKPRSRTPCPVLVLPLQAKQDPNERVFTSFAHFFPKCFTDYFVTETSLKGRN